jgi:microcystin-dependent protein
MFVNPYLANVTIFAGNFAPLSYALCQGQLLAISQNDALFALIGTTYGGDGITTFALPDLRGRKPVHTGQGPGLTNIILGEMSGTESVTMTSNQMPAHSHSVLTINVVPTGSSNAGTSNLGTNNYPAPKPSVNSYASAGSGSLLGTSVYNSSTPIAGNSQPIDILSPYLAMNYIIAIEGIFPSRN